MKTKTLAAVALAVVLVGAAAAGFVIWSGAIDVAASRAGGFPDPILAYAAVRSIRHHAKDETNPLASDPQALTAGLQSYREMCLACHGGPGVEAAGFSAGLHPPAPDLSAPDIQAFSDGMLYETIAGGIGRTGMPAFAPTHQPNELWALVAFLRHLPALSREQKQQLAGASPAPDAPPEPHTPTPPTSSDAGAHVHRISITNFKFEPAALEVQAGDVVEWTNTDFVAHTATAKNGAFDTGKLEGSQSKRLVVATPGTYPYTCRYHPGMTATLTVR